MSVRLSLETTHDKVLKVFHLMNTDEHEDFILSFLPDLFVIYVSSH